MAMVLKGEITITRVTFALISAAFGHENVVRHPASDYKTQTQLDTTIVYF